MIGNEVQLIEAEKWFDKLPSDDDRRTITGIVACAAEFDSSRSGFCFDTRLSNIPSYLGVYAVGSRSTGGDQPASDIDVLVAHNMRFGDTSDMARVNYFSNIDNRLNMMEGLDDMAEAERELSLVKAARELIDAMSLSLHNDPVAEAVSLAIARASYNYRLPHEFTGELPDSYGLGGKGHKAMVRYVRDVSFTPLDMIYYKGWHNQGPHSLTDEDLGGRQAGQGHSGDSGFSTKYNVCTARCASVGYSEGDTTIPFEEVIDTDKDGNPLPRIRLYTLSEGRRTIHIPQIAELVTSELREAREYPEFRPSWVARNPQTSTN